MEQAYDVDIGQTSTRRSASFRRRYSNKVSTSSSHQGAPSSPLWNRTSSKFDNNYFKNSKQDTVNDESQNPNALKNHDIDHELSKSMLVRVYSENERSNFNDVTGRRMYDDLKYRPIHHVGTHVGNQARPIEIISNPKRRYSTSVSEDVSRLSNKLTGYNSIDPLNDMQDEYIPDFDFSNIVAQWQHEEAVNDDSLTNNPRRDSTGLNCYNNWTDYEVDLSRSSSISSSSLLIKSTNAQVAPIPLPNRRSPQAPAAREADTESSQLPCMKTQNTVTSYNRGKMLPSLNTTTSIGSLERFKRQKSSQDIDSPYSPWGTTPGSFASINEGKISADDLKFVTDKLPEDFISLPYTQRKRILLDLLPGKDYRSIMSLLKKQVVESSKSNTQLKKYRSRHGSLASQFLSSFTPTPSSFKANDKGAIIMGYKLGSIIGFGAWGMIRECYQADDSDCQIMDKDSPQEPSIDDNNGSASVKAIKIVKFRNNSVVKKHVLKEVQIWGKLKHEHILRLISWKMEEDYAIYCLTERTRGGTLYDLVGSWGEADFSSISLETRCRLTATIALQVISALKYMHSNCIVHGDIKLENCLLKEVGNSSGHQWHVLLCDFGMSSRFGHRLTNNEDETVLDNDGQIMFHSPVDGTILSVRKRPSIPKSASQVSLRPLTKLQKIIKNKRLTHDDTPLGVSAFPKQYGPAMTSAHITERFRPSLDSSSSLEKLKQLESSPSIEVDGQAETITQLELSKEGGVPGPHSHIGSLPYAAPELLEPAPPPLGPSADVWALGVTLYTMLTGKLPFKHDYEPRLRAIITSGKYDIDLLHEVCNSGNYCNSKNDQNQCNLLVDVIEGCLQKNLTKRWELQKGEKALMDFLAVSSPQK